MSRAPFIVPPGRNAILDTAWKAHKAAQKAEGKAAKRKAVETEENAGSHAARVNRPSTSVKTARPASKVKRTAKPATKKGKK